MKEEILSKLKTIPRGTIILLNGRQYVKDTVTGSKKTYWFSMSEDEKLTNEDVAEMLLLTM